MDKLTVIRLLESGRSQRSVAKELGLNWKTVGRYWRQYQAAQRVLEQDPANPIKKEQLTAPPTYQTNDRQPRKYTPEIDQRVEEILAFDQLKAKQLGSHKQRLTTVAIHEMLVSIERILKPNNYVLNGAVAYRGEEFSDFGYLEVVDNQVIDHFQEWSDSIG